MLRPDLCDSAPLDELLRQPVRWAMRQEGAGAKRFLLETLSKHRLRSGGDGEVGLGEGLRRFLSNPAPSDTAFSGNRLSAGLAIIAGAIA